MNSAIKPLVSTGPPMYNGSVRPFADSSSFASLEMGIFVFRLMMRPTVRFSSYCTSSTIDSAKFGSSSSRRATRILPAASSSARVLACAGTNSRQRAAEVLADVPDDEVHRIVELNARELFCFDADLAVVSR